MAFMSNSMDSNPAHTIINLMILSKSKKLSNPIS